MGGVGLNERRAKEPDECCADDREVGRCQAKWRGSGSLERLAQDLERLK